MRCDRGPMATPGSYRARRTSKVWHRLLARLAAGRSSLPSSSTLSPVHCRGEDGRRACERGPGERSCWDQRLPGRRLRGWARGADAGGDGGEARRRADEAGQAALEAQRRLEQQKAEANRARDGRMGAASAVRRLDPVTNGWSSGEDEGSLRCAQGGAGRGRAGRQAFAGSTGAGWPGRTCDVAGGARERAQWHQPVKRGLAVVTRSNRFMLAKWADKTVPPLVAWDDRRKEADRRGIGMVEPPQLLPPTRRVP